MPARLVILPPQEELEDKLAARLAASFPELEVLRPAELGETVRAIATADGAYGTLPAEALAASRRLRWLQVPFVGPPAGYFYDALVAHPVVVTNMGGVFNEPIAAHIMACVLAFARSLPTYARLQAERRWAPAPLHTGVVHLPDASMAIVGVGGIGAEVARLAAAFGMHVEGVDARRRDSPSGVTAMYAPPALDDVLSKPEFVVVTVPETPSTQGLFSAERFARMRPGAFFINVGRGRTTRLADLVEALRSGRLAGAALDVFEEEPLPTEHPIWGLPNVIVTPHVSWYGPHLDDRKLALILKNCAAFLEGGALANVVDKANWF